MPHFTKWFLDIKISKNNHTHALWIFFIKLHLFQFQHPLPHYKQFLSLAKTDESPIHNFYFYCLMRGAWNYLHVPDTQLTAQKRKSQAFKWFQMFFSLENCWIWHRISTEVRWVCGPGSWSFKPVIYSTSSTIFWASTRAFHDGNTVEHHTVETTTSAKVKTTWIYTSTPHTYLYNSA
jgi:hypothetical protein